MSAALERLMDKPGQLHCLQRLGLNRSVETGNFVPEELYTRDNLDVVGAELIDVLVTASPRVARLLLAEGPVTTADFVGAGATRTAMEPDEYGVYACAGPPEWRARALRRVRAEAPSRSALWQRAVVELRDGVTRCFYVGMAPFSCFARFGAHKKGCVGRLTRRQFPAASPRATSHARLRPLPYRPLFWQAGPQRCGLFRLRRRLWRGQL